MSNAARRQSPLTPDLPRATGVRPAFVSGALAGLLLLLLWLLPEVVMVVLLAALLAIVLRGCADHIAARTGLREKLVLTLLSLMLLLCGLALAYWIGPKLLQQGQELAPRLANEARSLRAMLAQTAWGKPFARDLSSGLGAGASLLSPAETVLSLTLHTLARLVVLVVTTLYFAVSPGVYVRGLVSLLPRPQRGRAREVLGCTAAALRLWMLGQFIDMVTVGVLAAVGLNLAGVPDPYALAVIAGLLTFIPYFGAIVAAIPALVLALSVGWAAAIWTVLIFLICHCVEGYLVAPLVQRRLLDLPPAISIVSMMVMGTLFGTIGVILGTPVAAAGLILVRELYYPEVLGEPPS